MIEPAPVVGRLSFKEFLKYATKPNAPTYTKMYWPISQPLSYFLYSIGFTPNAVSFTTLGTGIIGGVLLFFDFLIPGLVMLLISYIFDFCDGNVARVYFGHYKVPQGAQVTLGVLIENLYANVSYAFLFLGLGYYFFVHTGNPQYFFFGTLAYVIKLISRYTVLHLSLINRKESIKNELLNKPNLLFATTTANKVKYVFTNIIDNARVYFLSFLIVALFFEQYLIPFFVLYMTYVLLINFAKLSLTLIRRQP